MVVVLAAAGDVIGETCTPASGSGSILPATLSILTSVSSAAIIGGTSGAFGGSIDSRRPEVRFDCNSARCSSVKVPIGFGSISAGGALAAVVTGSVAGSRLATVCACLALSARRKGFFLMPSATRKGFVLKVGTSSFFASSAGGDTLLLASRRTLARTRLFRTGLSLCAEAGGAGEAWAGSLSARLLLEERARLSLSLYLTTGSRARRMGTDIVTVGSCLASAAAFDFGTEIRQNARTGETAGPLHTQPLHVRDFLA